jgi:hypothetical protein
MTEYGGVIRDSEKIDRIIEQAREQYSGIEKIKIESGRELPGVFKLNDLWLTHLVYLEAIREYLKKGGVSRGSFIVIDPSGCKPCENLEDFWKFSVNDENSHTKDKILEVEIKEDLSIKKNCVDVRPVPDVDLWFERVWKDFREGKIIK